MTATTKRFDDPRGLGPVLDALPAAAYLCDRDGLITYFNEHARSIWGRAPKLNDPEDRYCGSFRLYAPDGSMVPHERCWMALALRHGIAYEGHEIVIERSDGQRFTVLAHATPLLDDEGRIRGCINVLIDITDRKQTERARMIMKQRAEAAVRAEERVSAALEEALENLEAKQQELLEANERLARLATIDDLTGLKTRAVFQNSIDEMLSLAVREGSPLSVLMIDADHFKRVNDTWGHQQGDRALRSIGHALRSHTRDQDVVARYGGEEFAILLPNTDGTAASNVAETLRTRCSSVVDTPSLVTVSIGVATSMPEDSGAALLARADRALYASKQKGRNRVTHADEALTEFRTPRAAGVAEPRADG